MWRDTSTEKLDILAIEKPLSSHTLPAKYASEAVSFSGEPQMRFATKEKSQALAQELFGLDPDTSKYVVFGPESLFIPAVPASPTGAPYAIHIASPSMSLSSGYITTIPGAGGLESAIDDFLVPSLDVRLRTRRGETWNSRTVFYSPSHASYHLPYVERGDDGILDYYFFHFYRSEWGDHDVVLGRSDTITLSPTIREYVHERQPTAAPALAPVFPVRFATQVETCKLIRELNEEIGRPVCSYDASEINIRQFGGQRHYGTILVNPELAVRLSYWIDSYLYPFFASISPSQAAWGQYRIDLHYNQERRSYYLPYMVLKGDQLVFYVFQFNRDDWEECHSTQYGSTDVEALGDWIQLTMPKFRRQSATEPAAPTMDHPAPFTRWSTEDETGELVRRLRQIERAMGAGDVPINQLVKWRTAAPYISGMGGGQKVAIDVFPIPGAAIPLKAFVDSELVPTLQAYFTPNILSSSSSMYRFPVEETFINVFPMAIHDATTGERVVYLFVMNAGDFLDEPVAALGVEDPDAILGMWPKSQRLYLAPEEMDRTLDQFITENIGGVISHLLPDSDVPFFGDFQRVHITPEHGRGSMLGPTLDEIVSELGAYEATHYVGVDQVLRWTTADGKTELVLPLIKKDPNGRSVIQFITFWTDQWPMRLEETGTDNPKVTFSELTEGRFPSFSPTETARCQRCSRQVSRTELSDVIVGQRLGSAGTVNNEARWCAACAGAGDLTVACGACAETVARYATTIRGTHLFCPRCGSIRSQARSWPVQSQQAQTLLPQGPSIRQYHTTTRVWVPRGKPENGVYYGVELEVVHESGETDKYLPAADALTPLKMLRLPHARTAKEWIIVEFDGSLRNRDTGRYYGFEVIFHPVSPEFARDHEELFGNVLDTLTKNGMISYQSVKFRKPDGDLLDCGIHISVTRDAVPALSQVKLQKLFYENTDFIWRVSRRRKESLDNWARLTPPETESGERVTYAAVAKDKARTIKYMALNFKPEVIEMRIFRGTLKLESLMMDLQFAQAAVEFSMDLRYGMTEITLPNFLSYVCAREREFVELGSWLRQKGLTDGYC